MSSDCRSLRIIYESSNDKITKHCCQVPFIYTSRQIAQCTDCTVVVDSISNDLFSNWCVNIYYCYIDSLFGPSIEGILPNFYVICYFQAASWVCILYLWYSNLPNKNRALFIRTGFFLTNCDNPKASISNFLKEACKDY